MQENMLFVLLLCLKLCSCIDIEDFALEVVKYIGVQDIEFYSNSEDYYLSKLTVLFWQENIKASIFNENSIHNNVFVFGKNVESLKFVEYHYSQIWLMHEDNMKYIDCWNFRLDSLVYLWKENENETVEIKVLCLQYEFFKMIF